MITTDQLTRAIVAARSGLIERMYAELADGGADWYAVHAAVLAELVELRAECDRLRAKVGDMRSERLRVEAEVERLRGLLRESCDLTDEALGYAPDCFKVKWGLPEAAARIRREGGLTEVERLKRGGS